MSLSRISGQSEHCCERADALRLLANNPRFSAAARKDFRDMELRWLELAKSYDNAEQISGFLEWQSKGCAPPPDFDE